MARGRTKNVRKWKNMKFQSREPLTVCGEYAWIFRNTYWGMSKTAHLSLLCRQIETSPFQLQTCSRLRCDDGGGANADVEQLVALNLWIFTRWTQQTRDENAKAASGKNSIRYLVFVLLFRLSTTRDEDNCVCVYYGDERRTNEQTIFSWINWYERNGFAEDEK